MSAIRRLGDFSEIALSPRLLARTPARLLDALPAFRIEEAASLGSAFRSRPWDQEATAVLEVGNFVHELWHAAQFTSRSFGVYRISGLYEMARRTNNFLASLAAAGNWPPPLPLLHRARTVMPQEFDEWHYVIRLLDMATYLREGSQDMLEEFRLDPTCPPGLQGLIPNPVLADLDFPEPSWVGNQGELPITTDLLIESEATYIERRFLEHWFGETGRDVFLAGIRDTLRPDYDVLPILANHEGMSCLLPLLIDWALNCRLQVPFGDLASHQNPSHRFALLYRAARAFQGVGVPALCEHREEIVARLAAETGLPRPEESLVEATKYLSEFADGGPMNIVLYHNMTFRWACPEYFLWPEKHLGQLMGNLAVPHFVFRDAPEMMHAFDVVLTLDQRKVLQGWALTAFNCLSMAFGERLECPWCSVSRPSMGARLGGGRPRSGCSCGWHQEFLDRWQFDPLEAFNEPR